MKLVRRADLVPQPWKNGGGVTREIAAHPPGAGLEDFDWRLSMAEIASDGPFSAFPGIDRTLTVIEGDGLALDFGAGAVDLPALRPLAFPGEAPVAARLRGGPVTDLNVMTRRAALSHAVRLLPPGAPIPAGTAALVALTNGMAGGQAISLGDTLLIEPDEMPQSDATMLAVMLFPADRT
ncbi:HutD family protein [Paracoccus contaminans]|uniref:HutD-family protein n=1 Tax=Paracoccus contaminans TaxID=1945662 RepID=A0A1W6CZ30_9RHOB|nr:HutD family protein [Paracoccus contaminans]ARJ70106.1 hypothetical protein B0A89_11155 [Paracoccus contaminans]